MSTCNCLGIGGAPLKAIIRWGVGTSGLEKSTQQVAEKQVFRESGGERRPSGLNSTRFSRIRSSANQNGAKTLKTLLEHRSTLRGGDPLEEELFQNKGS